MASSLYVRFIAAAAVWIAVALVVTGIVISRLLHDFVEQNFESRLAAKMVAVMAAISYDTDGHLLLTRSVAEPEFDRILSGWYWQIADGEQVLIGSRSLWNHNLGVEAGTTTGVLEKSLLTGPSGEILHGVWRDFTLPGAEITLRVTVAAPRSEIEVALNAIVPPLMWSLGILGFGLVAAVLAQVHFGLRPLNQVRRNLAAIRQGQLEQLPLEPQVEISPLVNEINALIIQNREVVQRTRTHVRNLAHRMKTPLAVLGNEIREPGRDPEGVMADCIRVMERQIQYHLRRARTAASRNLAHARTLVEPVVGDVMVAMQTLHRARKLEIVLLVEGQPVFAGEQQDLEEMLGNIVDNACKWAASRVVISCLGDNASVIILIADDGPGMLSAPRTGDGTDSKTDIAGPSTAGFGIAIVEDIVGLYGGSVDYSKAGIGGLQVRLVLPGVTTLVREGA